ncbi:MAG: hypothetical protein A2Y38_05640 [Spirochaetes bacterium GWB1_59_5]|nr:MAG: hypothetical protein A2Y38_05640 [Spirochaetes bacterium GWB1_59_5]
MTLTPYEAESADRNIAQPWMGNGGKLIVSTRQKLSFDVALAGSGTAGTAPKIGKLLRAVGFAQTVTAGVKVEYTLISEAFESAAFYINIDGVLHKGMGARGTASGKLDAKGIPLLHVEVTALYLAPVDAAPPTVDRTGWPIERPVNSANTLVCTVNAVNSFYSKFEFNLANQVSHDDFPGGYQVVKIGDRQPSASITLLAELLATFNPFTLADNNTSVAVQVVHGTTAGSKVQVDLKTKIVSVNNEDINGSVGYNLGLSPEAVSGNDEIKITFL